MTKEKNDNEAVTVSVRMIYENREDDGERVSPLLWNKIGDYVVYAPVGSGREFRLPTKEFLDKFKLLPNVPTVGRNI